MANERIIGFKIVVEGSEQIVNTINGLEEAVKNTNKELKKTDIGSEEYKKLTKELTAAKVQLIDIKKEQAAFVKDAQKVSPTAGSYDDLKTKITTLKEEFKGLSKEAREGVAGGKLLSQIRKLDKEIKVVNNTLKVTTQEFVEVTQVSEKSIAGLELKAKELNAELKKAEFGTDAYEKLSKELVITQRRVNNVRKSQRDLINDTKKVEDADGSYRQLNARLVELRRSYKELSGEAREGIVGQKALQEIQELDTQLKQLDTTIGQSQRNVGNYQSAFDGLGGAIGGGISGIASFAFGAAGVGAAGDLIIQGAQAVAELTEEFRVLRGTIEQMTGATGSSLDEFTARISGITTTFNADTQEVLQSATALSKELGVSFGDALTAIEKGFIAGADANGEFLDSLKEYSAQAKAAGLDTAQFVSILNSSAKEGVFSDKGIDAVKEFGLRIREQTQPVKDALDGAFGEKFTSELFGNLNSGAVTTVDALQTVVKQMNSTEIPGNRLQAVFADVFSAAGEDAGIRFISTLGEIGDDLNNLEGSAAKYAVEQARILELNTQLAASQNELSKELSGGTQEFQSLFLSIQSAFFDGLTQAIKNIKFLAVGIKDIVLGIRDFVGQNELLESTLGRLIRFIFTFGSLVGILFTQDLPAAFAGFQAAVGQTVANVQGFFNDLALGAEIVGQQLNLALSIKSETKERIRKDILSLKLQRKEAAESGKTIGEAFNEAFEASVVSQKAITDRQAAEAKALQKAAAQIDKSNKEVKKKTVAVKKEEVKEVERIALASLNALDTKRIDSIDGTEAKEKAAIESTLTAFRLANEAKIQSEQETQNTLAEQRQANQKAIQEGSIQAAQLLADTTFQIAANRAERQKEEDLAILQEEEEEALSRFAGNEAKQEQIKQKFEAKRNAIEEEASKKEKKRAISQALINGALAVTRILAEVPKGDFGIATGVLIGLAVAQTAAQVAIIGSQKFARGGILDGPSHAQGGIPTPFGEVQGGEAVINKESTRKHRGLLSAINEDGGGIRFQNGGIAGGPLPLPRIASASGTSDAFVQLAMELREENRETRRLAIAVSNQIVTQRVVLDTEELGAAQSTRVQLDDARTL